MTRYRSWLPDGVLQSDQARRPVAAIVGEWSDDWIFDLAWRATGSWAPADITLGDEWTSLRQSGGISVLGSANSVAKLAQSILGIGNEAANLRDLKLMRRLAGEALDDLTGRLQACKFQREEVPAGGSAEPEWVIAVESAGEVALKLLCSQDCVAAMARKTFERSRLPALREPRSAGLEAVGTQVGALLGRARLSVDSLLSLAIGDVLVLDRPSTDPLEMIVAGRPTRLLGTISEQHGQLALELQDAA